MGNTKTKFDLDELNKAANKNPDIGEFIPVSGTVIQNGMTIQPFAYFEKNFLGKTVNFYLEKLGSAGGVSYEFKEEYAKIIRDELESIQTLNLTYPIRKGNADDK